ncbi:hypothetical protein BH10CYA1_BH10CYA1_41920 [soil metagenome]
MFKKFGYVAVATMLIGIGSSCAFADTIDEQQKELLSQLAVAKNNKQISGKQASELDHDMRDLNKTKRQLREAHGDVVTTDDEKKLNLMINDVAQKLETMTANKVSLEKSKAPKE